MSTLARESGRVYAYSMREALDGTPHHPYKDGVAVVVAQQLALFFKDGQWHGASRDPAETTIRIAAKPREAILWVTVTPLCDATEALAVATALNRFIETYTDVRVDERCLEHDDCVGFVDGEWVDERLALHLGSRCVLEQRERLRLMGAPKGPLERDPHAAALIKSRAARQ